jgi:hypothetical protein
MGIFARQYRFLLSAARERIRLHRFAAGFLAIGYKRTSRDAGNRQIPLAKTGHIGKLAVTID